jgi:hypothetical protein
MLQRVTKVAGAHYLFLLDAFKDLFTMYCYVFRRINTDADLVAFDAWHRHCDLISDPYGFPDSSRQNQHRHAPCVVWA